MTSRSSSKPLASISFDLDNQWSYMKTHGNEGWKTFPSYLDLMIPHVLDLLDQAGLSITFFVVGRDAALEKNGKALQLLTARGHEIGNHSFEHEPWMNSYAKDKLEEEIAAAETHIVNVTGQRPSGFRGPGFAWSPALLEILARRGYLYDASTFPTCLGPLARLYYFATTSLTPEEKEERKNLFGCFTDGLRPVKPYWWTLTDGTRILEIPVTTIPMIKIPFHLSYLLYLSRFSFRLMNLFLETAITFCRITGTQPSFLLHPLDVLGGDQVPELAFFPSMDLDRNQKMRVFDIVIKKLSRHFRLVNMSTHAAALRENGALKTVRVHS